MTFKRWMRTGGVVGALGWLVVGAVFPVTAPVAALGVAGGCIVYLVFA